MDVAERSNGFEPAVKSATKAERAQMWTALPATVVSYDADKQTVSAQPTIQGVHPLTGAALTMPVCPDCPVEFPRGGGFAITWPLNEGDEGMLVFASRCIDAWWQSGGVQPQAEMRMHDLSDGVFRPGVTSQPRKLTNVFTDGMEMRTDDGSTHIRLTPGMVDILGALHVSGAVTTDSTITSQGVIKSLADVVAKTVSLFSHLHLAVKAGTDLSGGPKP